MDCVVGHFSYGGMSLENCQRNLGRFARKVMPALQHDRTFTAAAAVAGW
jgi:hypothetical protein